MARRAISLNVVSATAPEPTFTASGHVDVGADRTTVAANVATLVADGASPTQAHVTTLNTNWGLLNTDIGGDVILSYETTNVVSKNVLLAALRLITLAVQGSNDLT